MVPFILVVASFWKVVSCSFCLYIKIQLNCTPEIFRTSTQVGPSTGSSSALSVFQLYSDGNGVSYVTEDVRVQAASVFLLELEANESKAIYSFRAAASDEKSLWNIMRRACERNAQDWIDLTAKSYENWFVSGVQPNVCSEAGQGFKNGNSCLDQDAAELFTKSLILMKNSQNPTLGLFASSFHTLYGWKVKKTLKNFVSFSFFRKGMDARWLLTSHHYG